MEKSLKVQSKLLGKYHISISKAYNNLGVFYAGDGNYEKSIQAFLKSLEILKKLYTEKNP